MSKHYQLHRQDALKFSQPHKKQFLLNSQVDLTAYKKKIVSIQLSHLRELFLFFQKLKNLNKVNHHHLRIELRKLFQVVKS